MKKIYFVLSIILVAISLVNCEVKTVDDNMPAYMNDSTLTIDQKKQLAVEDHLKNNPIIFKMIYENNKVPSVVDDFTKIDVIEMSYDSMTYLILRYKHDNSKVHEVINVTKDKAMIDYYRKNPHKNIETIKKEDKDIFGTDITKGYFDKN